MSHPQEPTAAGMAARTSVILFIFVIAFTALLAAANALTAPAIKESAAIEEMRLIKEVLPVELYDNDLLADTIELPATAELGQDDVSKVYRARLAGQPSALVFEAVAPDGYSGKIRLLIAVQANGQVAGVRVTQHKETPGLGDKIEIKKTDWITRFEGRFLGNPDIEHWKVKKDGGVFDQFAGATITPRGVVAAVRSGLTWFDAHKTEFLEAPSGDTTK